jgi:hypothetical protein
MAARIFRAKAAKKPARVMADRGRESIFSESP